MKYKNKKGFTLIELLVVIAIIGALSSIVFASLESSRRGARDVRRISDLRSITTALELYFSDHNSFPQAPDYSFTTEDASWTEFENLLRPYMSSLPYPPTVPDWQYEYVYFSAGFTPLNLEKSSYCVRLINGFYLYTSLEDVDSDLSAKDGGIADFVYEKFGGGYHIGPAPCPL